MRNLPLYRAIAEHFDDKCPCGIRVFEVPHKYDRMDIPERFENKSYDLQLTCFNPSSKILSPVGLPTVFAGDGTGIAVFGENAKYLPETDFGKGLLLDARAAEILSARGLDVGLRGEGKGFPKRPPSPPTESPLPPPTAMKTRRGNASLSSALRLMARLNATTAFTGARTCSPALRNGSPAGNCPRGPRGLPIFT